MNWAIVENWAAQFLEQFAQGLDIVHSNCDINSNEQKLNPRKNLNLNRKLKRIKKEDEQGESLARRTTSSNL